MIELSIVLPTCNRAELLARSLRAIHDSVSCEHEIIVVDGASTDHTASVLDSSRDWLGDRLVVIAEPKREGFVRACNKGFRAAKGKYLTWLNDDARPSHGAIELAIAQLRAGGDRVAFTAMFHCWNSPRNIAFEAVADGNVYRLCHVRGTLYANFPVGKRSTFADLDYFDERYFVRAADPDLSLKAWHAGLQVIPAFGAYIDHDEVVDDRRAADSARGDEDNRRLFAKWDLPDRNPIWNDFDPANPCTLRGLRSIRNAA